MVEALRMTEMIMDTNDFPDILFKLIKTERVRVKAMDGVVQLMPVDEGFDFTFGLRGMFSEYDDMTVDKFLGRKRADEQLYS